MKRSSAVPLALVTAVAASLTACREKPTRYCVDENNVVVKDDDCRDQHWIAAGAHYYYYGGGRGYIAPGTRISGGSTAVPSQGFSTPPESVTTRGGIGEAGEAAAGHAAGGEGGHAGGAGE